MKCTKNIQTIFQGLKHTMEGKSKYHEGDYEEKKSSDIKADKYIF